MRFRTQKKRKPMAAMAAIVAAATVFLKPELGFAVAEAVA